MALHTDAPATTVRLQFERWLTGRQEGAAVAEAVAAVRGRPGRNLLIDAGWDGQPHHLAVRIALQDADSIADSSDIQYQFLTLQRLRTQLHRPAVPSVLWWERSAEPLGAPFFVMTRVEGQTADEDVLPYTFGSWITDATSTSRQRMQQGTVEQLARVHASAPSDFGFLDRRRPGETPLAAHLRQTLQVYRQTQQPVPLIERGFAWLSRHWPDESPPVLCWGDARIGNVVYRDFTPLALLDWELATLAPRELDLGSLIFVHRALDERARAAGLPGLPDLLRPAEVADAYAAASGYRPTNLNFYVVYAAVQHAVLEVRKHLSTNVVGFDAQPDALRASGSSDAMIPHRQTLAAMIDGA